MNLSRIPKRNIPAPKFLLSAILSSALLGVNLSGNVAANPQPSTLQLSMVSMKDHVSSWLEDAFAEEGACGAMAPMPGGLLHGLSGVQRDIAKDYYRHRDLALCDYTSVAANGETNKAISQGYRILGVGKVSDKLGEAKVSQEVLKSAYADAYAAIAIQNRHENTADLTSVMKRISSLQQSQLKQTTGAVFDMIKLAGPLAMEEEKAVELSLQIGATVAPLVVLGNERLRAQAMKEALSTTTREERSRLAREEIAHATKVAKAMRKGMDQVTFDGASRKLLAADTELPPPSLK